MLSKLSGRFLPDESKKGSVSPMGDAVSFREHGHPFIEASSNGIFPTWVLSSFLVTSKGCLGGCPCDL